MNHTLPPELRAQARGFQMLADAMFPATASPAAVAAVTTEPPIDRAVYAEALDIVAELASKPSFSKVEYLMHRAAKLTSERCPVDGCETCAEEREADADEDHGCYGSLPR